VSSDRARPDRFDLALRRVCALGLLVMAVVGLWALWWVFILSHVPDARGAWIGYAAAGSLAFSSVVAAVFVWPWRRWTR
jgi:hypothetical protein